MSGNRNAWPTVGPAEGQCAINVGESEFETGTEVQQGSTVIGSTISRHTKIGHFSTVFYADIGPFCSISWHVTIGAGAHETDCLTTHEFPRLPQYGFHSGPSLRTPRGTTIGADVWIGCHAIIAAGVHIGHGAIIGAGAVVTRDIHAYDVVAGVPARRLRRRFPDHVADELLELRWWQWPDETIAEHLDLFRRPVDAQVLADATAAAARAGTSVLADPGKP